jgi:hypothetical protein
VEYVLGGKSGHDDFSTKIVSLFDTVDIVIGEIICNFPATQSFWDGGPRGDKYRHVFFWDRRDWILSWSAEIDGSESSVTLGVLAFLEDVDWSWGSSALGFLFGMKLWFGDGEAMVDDGRSNLGDFIEKPFLKWRVFYRGGHGTQRNLPFFYYQTSWTVRPECLIINGVVVTTWRSASSPDFGSAGDLDVHHGLIGGKRVTTGPIIRGNLGLYAFTAFLGHDRWWWWHAVSRFTYSSSIFSIGAPRNCQECCCGFSFSIF